MQLRFKVQPIYGADHKWVLTVLTGLQAQLVGIRYLTPWRQYDYTMNHVRPEFFRLEVYTLAKCIIRPNFEI